MKVFRSLFPALLAVSLMAGNVFASHYDYLTDLSAEWIANPNRLATTSGADAAVYNPAGTAFMNNGLYFNVSNQTILNFYSAEVASDYPGDFKESKSHKPSPVVPNVFLVYKQDDWSAFAMVNLITGTGSFNYANGLPSVNEKIRIAATSGLYGSLSAQLVDQVIAPTDFAGGSQPDFSDTTASTKIKNSRLMGTLNCEVRGAGIAPAIGGAYKFNNMIAASLSLRYLTSIKSSKATFVRGGKNGLDLNILEAEMKATGITPVVGLNIRPADALNVGFSFEAPTKLEYEIDIKKDLSVNHIVSAAGGKPDGGKYRFDLPGKVNFGVEYAVTNDFKVMASGIYYLSKWMKMEKFDSTGKKVDIDKKSHSYEIGAGFEWKFIQNVAWTGGIVWDYINQPEENISDELFKNNCLNVGTGFSIDANDRTKFTIGFMRNFYPDLKRSNGAEAANGSFAVVSGKSVPLTSKYDETYHKESWVVAVGMQYNFL
jgi:long-chain fatty acid transport protein